MMRSLLCVYVGVCMYVGVGVVYARDYISIVGSSTVFPYTQAVSEEFGLRGDFASPVVESTGTGGGMKIFCGGVGVGYTDIVGASRAIRKKEAKRCRENGVDGVTEIRLGSDGIVLASALVGLSLDLSLEAIYLALAKEVPVGGKREKNPYEMWSDVGERLGYNNFPSTPIRVFGPPPTSGTRDAFVELAMEKGCEGVEGNEGVEKRKKVCGTLRSDGAYIDSGENDNLIIQRLLVDKEAMGIFGYSFLYENPDKIRGMKVEGVLPSLETIGDGSYPVARPLFLYVKEAHRLIIPGMDEFLGEYLSEGALSEDGYLVERGLIVPNLATRKALREEILGY